MSYVEAIVLGLVQGLTEFLPVSSSAHLVLTRFFFDWQEHSAEFDAAFDVALHMGTLIALLVYFRKDWIEITRQLLRLGKPVSKAEITTPSFSLIVIGSIPAVVFGLILNKHVEQLRNPLLIAATLAIFAVILWATEKYGKKTRALGAVGWKDSLKIGVAQAVALIPGVSRSGVTITAGLGLGFTRQAAARFSFLLATPITAGAGLVKAKHIGVILAGSRADAQAVALGFLVSLVSGIAALELLTRILNGVNSKGFRSFVLYRLALSFVIVVFVIIR